MAKPNSLNSSEPKRNELRYSLHFEQHKLQRLANRKQYYEKSERQKRTHCICNLGGTTQSLAPENREKASA